jgi:hypothetical protein
MKPHKIRKNRGEILAETGHNFFRSKPRDQRRVKNRRGTSFNFSQIEYLRNLMEKTGVPPGMESLHGELRDKFDRMYRTFF